ncbi:HlyD family type I secretion periplasmic adaptor subunit [Spiribacter roseus]|uniref:Membrane fusion protein (MFP) family protein n=1 Tax=Spiribacter roseus TaxID=1855875 RepID=A0ABV3RX48_9GAMM
MSERDYQTELRGLADQRRPIWAGLAIIVLGLGSFLAWALFGQLDSAVIAPGTVTVQSERQSVQHLEGGIIDAIYVRNGDAVEPGDLLFLLDDTSIKAEFELARKSYLRALAVLARLAAEREGADQIHFPPPYPDAVLAETEAEDSGLGPLPEDLPPLPERLRDAPPELLASLAAEQRAAMAGRQELLASRVDMLERRLDGLQDRIAAVQAEIRANETVRASIQEELESEERLVALDAVPAANLRPLQRELAAREASASALQSELAEARSSVAETRAEIVLRREEVQSAVSDERRRARQRLEDLQARVIGLADRMTRLEVRAPAAGEIINQQVHTTGAVIRAGETLLEIVPGGSAFRIEARVSPRDIDPVDIGMDTDVRLTALDARSTPMLPGVVERISADRLSTQTGLSYFAVDIALLAEGLEDQPEVRLRPGMPAEVLIRTGAQSPMDYLLKPLSDAFSRALRES